MSHWLQLSAPYHLCGVDYTVAVPSVTLTKTQYYRIIGHGKFSYLYERKMLTNLNLLYLKLGYVNLPSFEYWIANILPEDMKKARESNVVPENMKMWYPPFSAEDMKRNALRKKQWKDKNFRIEREALYRLQKEKFEKAVEDKLQQLRVAEKEKRS
jgi:hypothetical protein